MLDVRLRRLLGAALVVLALATGLARADDKALVMKMSVATINDTQHEWIKMFVAGVEKASSGRIKGEIYPASQLGSIPRQIEGTQFGAIQGWVGPPEFLVGVDERLEVMSAPGVFSSVDQALRVAADPAVHDMVLGMGANKGLKGIALFLYGPSSIITRKPVRHLAEFKGMKLRVTAAQYQNEMITRMGGTPVAMTLGDVLPALQQGAIDGSISSMPVFTTMQYVDVTKTVTDTGQPYIFSVAEMSRKWFDGLAPDLQKIIVDEGAKAEAAIVPWRRDFYAAQTKAWTDKGGELIDLPPAEQTEMLQRFATIGDDLSKSKPGLNEAFKTLSASAQRQK